MAPAVLRLLKFTTKVAVAGGAVYVAYDYGLLGSGTQGEEALNKTTAAVPPAVHEWADYFGLQKGLVESRWLGYIKPGTPCLQEFCLPSTPKLDFSLGESWNWGVQKSVSALSSAPNKACEYTADGWKYIKDSVK
ncbi:unnamed protein product [Staurois parvus]|uniref:MICOS complex subunit MIC13 n=1 Tax=Staurois parvus TaxID=386267 RepID=A0ABN9B6V8_9NEOB|nr:unnamed protein product [Staurois parvus]